MVSWPGCFFMWDAMVESFMAASEAPRLYKDTSAGCGVSALPLSGCEGCYDCMRAIIGLPHRLRAPPISSPCSSAIHLFAGKKRALCHSAPISAARHLSIRRKTGKQFPLRHGEAR